MSIPRYGRRCTECKKWVVVPARVQVPTTFQDGPNTYATTLTARACPHCGADWSEVEEKGRRGSRKEVSRGPNA